MVVFLNYGDVNRHAHRVWWS